MEAASNSSEDLLGWSVDAQTFTLSINLSLSRSPLRSAAPMSIPSIYYMYLPTCIPYIDLHVIYNH